MQLTTLLGQAVIVATTALLSSCRVDQMVHHIAHRVFPSSKVVVGQILQTEVHGFMQQYAQVGRLRSLMHSLKLRHTRARCTTGTTGVVLAMLPGNHTAHAWAEANPPASLCSAAALSY